MYDEINHEASSMGWTFSWEVREDRPTSPFDPSAPFVWTATLFHAHGPTVHTMTGRANTTDSADTMALFAVKEKLADIRWSDKQRAIRQQADSIKEYRRMVR